MFVNFYYDRIRIFTDIPKEGLLALIDIEELRKHAGKVEIGEAFPPARIHGYKGRIELSQASDKAIEVLQSYSLERHTISYIEVTKDIVVNNDHDAQKYKQAFQDNHYLRWGKGCFSIGSTHYMGKEQGKKRGIYLVCYTPVNGKCGNQHVVHMEFKILNMINVKRKLGVNTIYDLGRAEDHFEALANKYIVRAEVNLRRVKKHFPYMKIYNVSDLIDFMFKHKQRIRDRKDRRNMLKIIAGTKLLKRRGIRLNYSFSNKEELYLHYGVGYWLKKANKAFDSIIVA